MAQHYPTPEEVGIRIPVELRPERFRAGFEHALHGRQLSEACHLRRSFMEGYRAAKLYLCGLRRRQGIIPFPMRGKVSVKIARVQQLEE